MKQPPGLRLVIAEDDFLVGTEVVRVAESIGCSVLGVARDGDRAVELVRTLRPDLALLDIQMRQVTGLEAARRIRDECPVPVVILTAYDSPELLTEATEAGVGSYLAKPPDRTEMQRAFTIARARFADLAALRQTNLELRRALDQVKTLSGLLPMCCYCKRIRTDQGYWQAVDAFISARTDATISHGMCQDCFQKNFPDDPDGGPAPQAASS